MLIRTLFNAKRNIPANDKHIYFRCVSATSGNAEGTAATKSWKSLWKKIWSKWVPIPTGVGLTILAVLQWRHKRRKADTTEQGLNNWEIKCYRAVPLRPISRAWGWLSDRRLPVNLRSWVYNRYATMYRVNLDEVEYDLVNYPSLSEFFCRRLKNGARPIDGKHCIVSPADGTVLNLSVVKSCRIEQVKGVTYSIQTFLGLEGDQLASNEQQCNLALASSDRVQVQSPSYQTKLSWEECKKKLLKNPADNELYQLVVYLAPGDYHRFHSPAKWRVKVRRHFQGELLSVSPRVAGWVNDLFSLNERVVYLGDWENGFFCFAAVGATNVGSIRVHSDPSLHTNGARWPRGELQKEKRFDDMVWEKGQEIGEFRMGSTVVVLFEAPKGFLKTSDARNARKLPGRGDRIMVGQPVTCFNNVG